MAMLVLDDSHKGMRPSLRWFGGFLGAWVTEYTSTGIFIRVASPGGNIAQPHTYTIDPIGQLCGKLRALSCDSIQRLHRTMYDARDRYRNSGASGAFSQACSSYHSPWP